MRPPIENSVVKISASRWLLGSSMICESDLTVPPEDVKASWKGDDGKTYYLRTAPTSLVAAPAGENTSESFEKDRVHQAGTSAAVWAFGGVHVKVKSWIPELESEQASIEHARKVNIPTPEVVFSWIDHAWNRSFLILRSIPGRTLDEAWPDLSLSERRAIADEVASFCTTLAMSCRKLAKFPVTNTALFETFSTGCFIHCTAIYLRIGCLPVLLKRNEIREKFEIRGSALRDAATACCCTPCALAQMETELKDRARKAQIKGEVPMGSGTVAYGSPQRQMVYQSPLCLDPGQQHVQQQKQQPSMRELF